MDPKSLRVCFHLFPCDSCSVYFGDHPGTGRTRTRRVAEVSCEKRWEDLRRAGKSWEDDKRWEGLRWAEKEVRWVERGWEEVGRVEKRWQGVRKVEKRWAEVRVVEKSWEEVKRVELRWEEMKKTLRAVEKSCENWEEQRWSEKSWKVVVTIEKEWGKRRTKSQNRVEKLWGSAASPLGTQKLFHTASSYTEKLYTEQAFTQSITIAQRQERREKVTWKPQLFCCQSTVCNPHAATTILFTILSCKKNIVFRMQLQQRGTLPQPSHCDLQTLSYKTQQNYAPRLQKWQLQNRISTPKRKKHGFEHLLKDLFLKENHPRQNAEKSAA